VQTQFSSNKQFLNTTDLSLIAGIDGILYLVFLFDDYTLGIVGAAGTTVQRNLNLTLTYHHFSTTIDNENATNFQVYWQKNDSHLAETSVDLTTGVFNLTTIYIPVD
jgi:hypothetical protein